MKSLFVMAQRISEDHSTANIKTMLMKIPTTRLRDGMPDFRQDAMNVRQGRTNAMIMGDMAARTFGCLPMMTKPPSIMPASRAGGISPATMTAHRLGTCFNHGNMAKIEVSRDAAKPPSRMTCSMIGLWISMHQGERLICTFIAKRNFLLSGVFSHRHHCVGFLNPAQYLFSGIVVFKGGIPFFLEELQFPVNGLT